MASTPAQQQQASALAPADNVPSASTLIHASRIAMKDDYPIQLDYYLPSCVDKVFIGEDQRTKESFLIKSPDEYTSNIFKVFRNGTEFIVLTENSLYIISANTKKKAIPADYLQ